MTTARQVNSLIRAMQPGRYHVGGAKGLYLCIKGGSAAWALRYQKHGRPHMLGIGSARDLTLEQARDRAAKIRVQIIDGIDPIAEKRRQKAEAARAAAVAVTFREATQKWIIAHQAEWKTDKFRRGVRSMLERLAWPVLGHLMVSNITVDDVHRTLSPIWDTKTATASILRGRIENVLDWAAAKGLRTGDNPARWSGSLQHLLAATSKIAPTEHYSALPFRDMAAFIQRLRQVGGPGAAALEFVILTATRIGEAVGASRDEINIEDKVWLIPASRMKAGKEHRVPLSQPALDLLARLPRHGRPFPSRNAVWRTLRATGYDNITVHGFRSAFRDWAAEVTNFERDVVEMALAHAIKNAVEAAYRRGDLFEKRRRLMDAWAAHCGQASAGANVVSLHG